MMPVSLLTLMLLPVLIFAGTAVALSVIEDTLGLRA